MLDLQHSPGDTYAQPFRMEDMARLAGMSMSTLHHHFGQAARQRIIAGGLDAASTAFAVGCESASQFNREYSRFFGQPPLPDVSAVRSHGYSSLESLNQ